MFVFPLISTKLGPNLTTILTDKRKQKFFSSFNLTFSTMSKGKMCYDYWNGKFSWIGKFNYLECSFVLKFELRMGNKVKQIMFRPIMVARGSVVREATELH